MENNQTPQAQTGDEYNQGVADPGQQPQNQGGQQPQPQQGAGDGLPKDAEGLKAALLAERSKRQDAESARKRAEEQAFLYSMNRINQPANQQGQQTPQGQQQPQEPKATVGIPDELSQMDDSEMISAGELKKFIGGLSFQGGPAGSAARDDQTQQFVGEQLLTIVKPDAEQIIAGNFAQRLQTAMPWEREQLVSTIRSAPAMLRPFIAYRLGQGFTPSQAQQGAVQDMTAANMNPASQGVGTNAGGHQSSVTRIVQNAQNPTPTSEVANAGAINSADRYKTMTDAEIDAEIERIKMVG